MTTNPNNASNHSPQQNGYNPVTLDDVQGPHQPYGRDPFGELSAPVVRWVAGPLLGFILFFTHRMPLMAPLAILVLLGCLFVRMNGHIRQIAAVPLTLAAIKLAFQMASHQTEALLRPGSVSHDIGTDLGFGWLPMFFAICLVYIPNRDSITFKVILGSTCLLLASGLLPGEGFVVIFYLLNGLLFVGIVAAIIADIKIHHHQVQPRPLQLAH
jgi:hypothetical protein